MRRLVVTRRTLLGAAAATTAGGLAGRAGAAGAAQGRLRLRRPGRRLRLQLRPRPGPQGGRGQHFGDKIKTTYVENVAEGPDAERVIRNLADDGNQLIFTTSFGFMNPTTKVAKRYPEGDVRALLGLPARPERRDLQRPLLRGPRGLRHHRRPHVEDRGRRLHRLLPDPRGRDGHQRLHARRAQGEPRRSRPTSSGSPPGTTRPRRPTPPRRSSTRAPTSSPSTPTARRRCRPPSSAA